MTRLDLVRRYSENEQASFEKSIDANPLEATNHLVYADWLDEHGHADEAAFRRSIGSWMRSHHENESSPHVREYWSRGSVCPTGSRRYVMPWRVSSSHVPDGVNIDTIQNWNTMPHSSWQFRSDGTGYFPRDPAHASFDWEDHPNNVSLRMWETYRGMEEGLRRAFMAGRPQQESVPEPTSPDIDINNTRLSRMSVVRYAQGQPPRPFGVPATTLVNKSPALPESLVGSKLALVLHEIAGSDLARKDAKLRQLARHALAGYSTHNGTDVYTQIRDRLLKPSDVKMRGYTRAAQLARQFNWHKVSGALDVDRELAKFIKSKGRADVVDSGRALRQAHDAYGNGWETVGLAHGIDSQRRERVLEAMRTHVMKSLRGYVPADEISRDHIVKSLNRLAHGEHAREVLGALPSKTNVTIPDHPKPAYFDTVNGPRANPKRGAGQFTRRGLVQRYALDRIGPGVLGQVSSGAGSVARAVGRGAASLFAGPDTVDEGVTHTSHPDGRLTEDDPAKVLAERSAILHSLYVLGLVPPRNSGESQKSYTARTSRAVEGMARELRNHVETNPFDPQVQHYTELSKSLAAPSGEIDDRGRISLPAPEVTTMGLSAALAPMVAKIAEQSGLRVGRHAAPGGLPAKVNPRRRVVGEHVPEPELDLASPLTEHGSPTLPTAPTTYPESGPRPRTVIGWDKSTVGGEPWAEDITDPPTVEDHAATALHDLDREAANRASWGSAKFLHDPTGHTDGSDFLDADLSEVSGLGTSPIVSAVGKAPSGTVPKSKPLTSKVREKIYGTIKDHLENSMGHVDEEGNHVPPEGTVVQHVMNVHGLTNRAASAVVGAYKKANAKGRAKSEPPAPTTRAYPPVPRADRLTRRGTVERYGKAPPENVIKIARQQSIGGENALYDPNNHSDGVLADYLDDHDDPLGLVVRRDMGYRAGGDFDGWTKALNQHMADVVGHPRPQTDYYKDDHIDSQVYGHIRANGYGPPIGGVPDKPVPAKAYRVVFDDAGSGAYAYASVVTPEEWQRIKNEHGPKPDNSVHAPTDGTSNTNEDPDSFPGELPVHMSRRETVRYASLYHGDEQPDQPNPFEDVEFAPPWPDELEEPEGELQPEEGDYHISTHGDHHRVHQYGHEVMRFPTVTGDAEIMRRLREHAESQGFFPNAWFGDDHYQYSRDHRRYAQSWTAPPGGMVARGTFYKGGQRIPSVGGEFMASGRRRRKRKPRAPKARLDTLSPVKESRTVRTPPIPRRRTVTTTLRYNREAFIDQLAKNENDTTTRKVFADWLEENEPDTAPSVLHTLRNYEGRLWVGRSPKGRVNAIPRLSKQLLEESATKSYRGTPTGEFYHSTATNRQGRAHRVRPSGKMKTWKTRPDEFRVPWKFGLYDNGEFNHRNVHEWLVDDPTAEPQE